MMTVTTPATNDHAHNNVAPSHDDKLVTAIMKHPQQSVVMTTMAGSGRGIYIIVTFAVTRI